MKKIMKIGAVFALSATISLGVFGCGPNRGANIDNKTKFSIYEYGGTAAYTTWLKDAINRFSKEKAGEVYEEGKSGVYISTGSGKDNCQNQLPDYDIIMNEDKASVYEMSSKGWLANIDDVVKKFENKIPEGLLPRGLGSDGKYYAMPHYSFNIGISYSIDTFEKYGLYLADSSVTNTTEYICPILNNKTFKFARNNTIKKTCGPDGKYGTYDDGLPSSIEELIAVCDYIKSKGVYPFGVADKSSGMNYSFMLIDSIWASIVGEDVMNNVFCNWGDEEVEVVVRDANGNATILNETVFSGAASVNKPKVENIKLSSDNGYRMYDMSARYYALKFFEIAKNQNWFGCSDTLSATATQESFILTGGKVPPENKQNQCAMLIDSSYWYGEASASGAINTFKVLNEGNEPRVSIMPMPVQIEGSVTENNGKKPTLLDVSSALFVNKRAESNPGVMRAIKEFIEFLYSDAELKAFTEKSKLKINMTYDFDENKLGDFYKRANEIEKDANKVYSVSRDVKVLKYRSAFSLNWGGYINYFANYHSGTYQAMQQGKTAVDVFNLTLRDSNAWNSLT